MPHLDPAFCATPACAAYAAQISPAAFRVAIDTNRFPVLHRIRTGGGHRRYSDADVCRLAVYQACRLHGFEHSEAVEVLHSTGTDAAWRLHGATTGLSRHAAGLRATVVHDDTGRLEIHAADVGYRIPHVPHALFLGIGLISANALRRRYAFNELRLRLKPPTATTAFRRRTAPE